MQSGATLPQFSLPSCTGGNIDQTYFDDAELCLVVFTCNHCPYVKGSEEQLVNLVREFEDSGLKTVTISSNNAVEYPEDSFENMKLKAEEMSLPYPYLYDESQDVARLFDAACTPEAFLYGKDKTLIFHGALNNNPSNAAQATEEHLRTAITQALAGESPEPSSVHPIGCSIKWKH